MKKYYTVTTVFLLIFPCSIFAANNTNGCSVNTSPVNFGNYNALSSSSDDSVGGVILTCSNQMHIIATETDYSIALSTGQSNNYITRTMSNSISLLNYNLYTDSNRSIIWGNGSNGTSVVSGKCAGNQCNPLTVPVYGRIPGAQNVSVGNYSDNIVVTVNFS